MYLVVDSNLQWRLRDDDVITAAKVVPPVAANVPPAPRAAQGLKRLNEEPPPPSPETIKKAPGVRGSERVVDPPGQQPEPLEEDEPYPSPEVIELYRRASPSIHTFRNETKANGLTLRLDMPGQEPIDCLEDDVILDSCSNCNIIALDMIYERWGPNPPVQWREIPCQGATGKTKGFVGSIAGHLITPVLRLGTKDALSFRCKEPWLVSEFSPFRALLGTGCIKDGNCIVHPLLQKMTYSPDLFKPHLSSVPMITIKHAGKDPIPSWQYTPGGSATCIFTHMPDLPPVLLLDVPAAAMDNAPPAELPFVPPSPTLRDGTPVIIDTSFYAGCPVSRQPRQQLPCDVALEDPLPRNDETATRTPSRLLGDEGVRPLPPPDPASPCASFDKYSAQWSMHNGPGKDDMRHTDSLYVVAHDANNRHVRLYKPNSSHRPAPRNPAEAAVFNSCDMEDAFERQNRFYTVEGVLAAAMDEIDSCNDAFALGHGVPSHTPCSPHYSVLPINDHAKDCIEAAERAYFVLRQRWRTLVRLAWQWRANDINPGPAADNSRLQGMLIRAAAVLVDTHHMWFTMHQLAATESFNSGDFGRDSRRIYSLFEGITPFTGWANLPMLPITCATPAAFGVGFVASEEQEQYFGAPYGVGRVQSLGCLKASSYPHLTRASPLTADRVRNDPRVATLRSLDEDCSAACSSVAPRPLTAASALHQRLPAEVWDLVVTPLTASDQGNTRAASHCLKTAVDRVQEGVMVRTLDGVDVCPAHIRYRALRTHTLKYVIAQRVTPQVVEDLLVPTPGGSSSLTHVSLFACPQLTRAMVLNQAPLIRHLRLQGCDGLVDITAINDLPLLEELNLRGCGQADAATVDFGPLTRLTHLDLAYTGLTSTRTLTRTKTLIRLWLTGCTQLPNMHEIRGNRGLRLLDIASTSLVDMGAIKGMPELRLLFMAHLNWSVQRIGAHQRSAAVPPPQHQRARDGVPRLRPVLPAARPSP